MDPMFGLPRAVALVIILGVVGLAAGAALWWDGQRAVAPTTVGRRALRHAALTRVVATLLLVFGTVAIPVLNRYGGVLPGLVGRVAALLPTASLLGFLALHAIGELTWPKPRGAERHARLVARTTSDITTGRLYHAPIVWFAALAAVSLLFGVMASGPRSLSRVIDGYRAHTVGPFPGWLWTVPILVAAAAVLVVTELVLRLIASRPAVEDVGEEWDMWLRRRAARSILRTVQLMLGLTLTGLVALAGLALRWLGLGSGGGAPAPVSQGYITVGNMVLVLALATAVAALVLALWPARDPAPASAGSEPAEARA
ncbi:hypothetical protein [Cellulomonas sp. PhB143]|uniref:hypothetical protein n=1 Tax=Cellulomonas sp. PhB143 TaxID=2485186 RepID=UPI000FBFAB8E|nr:hypothetical protein [Cellulomonas sp. PhB143]ROS75494.1 hypothetical protein EDF32_1904 [Cellulomonas sp. PhB143]